MFLGLSPPCLTQVMLTDFNIHAGIHRVTAQGFVIEVHVVQTGIIELIHTQTSQIQFFVRLIFVHRFCSVDHFRQRFIRIQFDRPVIYQQISFCIIQSGI